MNKIINRLTNGLGRNESTVKKFGISSAPRALIYMAFMSSGLFSVDGLAQDTSLQLEEVVVTARKREESLQEVPDAITVFSAATLEKLGIESVPEFMQLVPNMTFQEQPFRSGSARVSMRGVGNDPDYGWPPVTFIIDGVPVDSMDSLNMSSLADVERIEVLRGPQSALYGAGAITGAVNIVTKKPDDDREFKVKTRVANGDDKKVEVMTSGSIVPDELYYRLSTSYRDSDGLIDSASNGIDLDFEEQEMLAARLIYMPNDDMEIDFRASMYNEFNGATFQEKLPFGSDDATDIFNSSTEPRRRVPGTDDRESRRYSLRFTWDVGGGTLSSVTGYSELDQLLKVGICWDDPNDPAVDSDPLTPGAQAGCLYDFIGPSLGDAAGPGEIVDNHYEQINNFETITQDIRFTSSSDQSLRWIVGAQFMQRDSFLGFDAGIITAPDNEFVNLFPNWDFREDFWWGVYSQVSYDITDKLELAVAARYDENEHKNTRYSDRTRAAIVQSASPSGELVDTNEVNVNKFQPKVQLNYQWNDDLMTYFTWAEGYRAGFFINGSFTQPEETTNYEIGAKGTFFDGRILTNIAVFHIDYSNQQFIGYIFEEPFRVSTTIPETGIDGFELDASWKVNSMFTISSSLGYLDAKIDGSDHRPPLVSEWTANTQMDFRYPLQSGWEFQFNTSLRYQSDIYLSAGELPISRVPDKTYVDLRIGLENDHWSASLFSKNLLDERQAIGVLDNSIGGILRGQNKPRIYGITVSYTY